MTATTIAIGTTAAVISLFCWYLFLGGVVRIYRTIKLGHKVDSSRFWPIGPRLLTMLKEFLVHTRMVKFRSVGWAHWLVMIGFLGGSLLWFEAYGQSINPKFHWPVFGDTFAWHLWDELLGIGTVVGILVLIAIRQMNHPRVPERMSRFSGSRFGPAYFVEVVVLLEGLGMILVKASKIATYGHANAYSDFFTMQVAKILPASPTLVSIFAVIKLMSGMVWLAMVGMNISWGVAWHRFSAFLNIYLKREQDGGVALGALKPMMSQGKVLDMETADPDVDAFGAGKIEDFSWKGWLDFTTCTECGRCQSQCPAWNTGKPLSPKLLIMSLRDHGNAKAPYLLAGGRKDMGGDEVGLVDADGNVLEDKLNAIPEAARAEAARKLVGESKGDLGGGLPIEAVDGEFDPEALGAVIDTETLWSCTTCGACVEQCPVDIEHVDHILDMRRYQVLIESDFPTELAGMFKNLENKGNPWGQNASARTAWIDEMDIDIPVFGKDVESFEGFEYLFWVGCAGAYEDRAKKTTKAVAELLDMAAVNFMVLGEGETCTGDSARRAGNEFLFQMLAQQNIEMLGEVFSTAPEQRKKVVVTCAHCFNALGNEYPQLGAKYEVVHHTQLLNRLVREKRLVPVAPLGEGVTYHDPCYLGRHNKVYDAPRELMGAAGSTLTEMPRHGERSMCCGAGGARMWMEEQIGKRINIDRVDEALDTLGDLTSGDQVKKVATGCPFCRVMLTDGVTARTSGTEAEGKVEVVDVAQLLLDSVRRGKTEVKLGGRFLGPRPTAPEPEPEPEKVPAAAAASASATTEAAPKPKVGLGMKGGKKPGATAKTAAPEAAPAEAPADKKPAAKGFGMKGGKKPGAAAGSAAPATEAPAETTSEAPAEKKPAASKGFGMKGGAKRPGAASKPAATSAAPAPAEAESSEAVRDEVAEAAAEKKPAAKGFGMGKAKRPGQKAAPATNAAAPEAGVTAPAESKLDEAESAPDAAPTVDTESAPAAAPAAATTEEKPAKAKGFGMAAGKKRPGGIGKAAPTPAAAAPAAETASEAQPAPETETAEAPAAEAPATEAPATAAPQGGSAAVLTEEKPAKAKGFGMAAGKKRPGGIGKAAPAAAAAPVETPTPEAESEPAPEPEEAEASAAPEAAAADAPAADVAEPETAEAAAPSSNGSGDARTIAEAGASKAKGFGIAAGKKRPGHK
ncbi:4Fe-4S dicluster domain-containing protein [Gordonia jinghuaiqii]|uniref:(Fe-S)-binding protein n=1 Tax=Gordonia jinghuaiqii TaxID=2758710 RepID=A0A7D7RA75_9ACTN|nr:(Fe-S)-binding protein [Gordonia jinghuaiqii]MCR5978335.1 4Fe-4S dicluster domain-containing protein [Gordonia jinghuaiqii]QMT01230.1 (Fe-S)-binding protein [Gordonia jinghuaiqii]